MTGLTEEQLERIAIIKHKLKFIAQKPAVACVRQLNPLRLAGDDLSEMIGIAGGVAITGNRDEIFQQNPDIIMLSLIGCNVGQIMKGIDQMWQILNFAELKAVKNNRLYIVDGERFFNSNENIVDEIELLAEIINPKQFIFGYEGDGWVRFAI